MHKTLSRVHAAIVESDRDMPSPFAFGAFASTGLLVAMTGCAVVESFIKQQNCQAAFAQARGVPAGADIAVSSGKASNAQGYPECHATGVDKDGKPVTFIWNNQNNQPPRAAGLAFGN